MTSNNSEHFRIEVELHAKKIIYKNLSNILDSQGGLDDDSKLDIVLYCVSLNPEQIGSLLKEIPNYRSETESLIKDNNQTGSDAADQNDSWRQKLNFLEEKLKEEQKLNQNLELTLQENRKYKKVKLISQIIPESGDINALFKPKLESIKRLFCQEQGKFEVKMSKSSVADAFKLLKPLQLEEFRKYALKNLKSDEKKKFYGNEKFLREKLKATMCEEPLEFSKKLSEGSVNIDPEFLRRNYKLIGLEPFNRRLFTADERQKFLTNINLLKQSSVVTYFNNQYEQLKVQKLSLQFLTSWNLPRKMDNYAQLRELVESQIKYTQKITQEQKKQVVGMMDKLNPDFIKFLDQTSAVDGSLDQWRLVLEDKIKTLDKKIKDIEFNKTIDNIGRLESNVSAIIIPKGYEVKSLEITSRETSGATEKPPTTISSLTLSSADKNDELQLEIKRDKIVVAVTKFGDGADDPSKYETMLVSVHLAYEQWLNNKNFKKPINIQASDNYAKILTPILQEFLHVDSKLTIKLNGSPLELDKLTPTSPSQELREKIAATRQQYKLATQQFKLDAPESDKKSEYSNNLRNVGGGLR